MRTSMSFHKSSLVFGSAIALCLIVFFFIMKAVGLVHNVELRFLNVLILIGGIIFSINYRMQQDQAKMMTRDGDKTSYFDGIWQGMYTGFIASLLFSVFVFIYLNSDNQFMAYLHQYALFGSYLSPFSATDVILVESITTSFNRALIMILAIG